MPLHFNEINRFLAKIAILGPKVHFLAPNATSRTPCAKPFINTSSWEVFWRPRAAKVRFGPEKLEISLQNRNFVKKAFFAQKVQIPRKGWGIHEMLPFFALKRCQKVLHLLYVLTFAPQWLKLMKFH